MRNVSAIYRSQAKSVNHALPRLCQRLRRPAWLALHGRSDGGAAGRGDDEIIPALARPGRQGKRPAAYLLLDCDFCSVAAIRYLPTSRAAFLMPVPRRGRKTVHLMNVVAAAESNIEAADSSVGSRSGTRRKARRTGGNKNAASPRAAALRTSGSSQAIPQPSFTLTHAQRRTTTPDASHAWPKCALIGRPSARPRN
jgi:hypothetical protein